jgi:hypothetical protein
MSLLSRIKNTGGITSRSVRDSGIVGFKLDREILEGLVVEEKFTTGNWTQKLPGDFPAPVYSEIVAGAGVMMGFQNHNVATRDVPNGVAFDQGYALSPYGFPMPAGGGAPFDGVQHLWTDAMGSNSAGDTVTWYPGRFAHKVGKALNRGFLTKMKVGLAQFSDEVTAELDTVLLVFGVRAYPADLDPAKFWADDYTAYEDYACLRFVSDGVDLFNLDVEGKTPTLNGGDPLVSPSVKSLSSSAGDLNECIELACIEKDGRCGFWVNGDELPGPPNFAFPADKILLPFMWWRSALGGGIIDYKQFSYYRLHHVNTEIQEAEANILCNDGQVDAGPVIFTAQIP